jgi:hypothetical protein
VAGCGRVRAAGASEEGGEEFDPDRGAAEDGWQQPPAARQLEAEGVSAAGLRAGELHGDPFLCWDLYTPWRPGARGCRGVSG